MKALVYLGPAKKALEERPKPEITAPTDAIVKITKTTICGTDLHILKGDVPSCQPGRILGHEGVGIVDKAGPAVTAFKPGDRVLISCISACGKCVYCRKLMYSHCTTGGWILGNNIDGTQAEFVRIPYADTSLYPIPDGADEEALVMLSDILPTGFECGVLNGKVQPGSTVAIVGAGPIGLAALLTAQFYSPAEIIMIDLDDNRLEVAKRFGATAAINSADGKAVETVMKMTGERGVDTAIEAVGIPATFELCEKLSRRAAPSPISGCMERRWISIWRTCGTATSPSPRGWSTPSARRCCSTLSVSQDRPQAPDYASLQARPHPRCLRDLRARRQHASAQGDHRGLALAATRRVTGPYLGVGRYASTGHALPDRLRRLRPGQHLRLAPLVMSSCKSRMMSQLPLSLDDHLERFRLGGMREGLVGIEDAVEREAMRNQELGVDLVRSSSGWRPTMCDPSCGSFRYWRGTAQHFGTSRPPRWRIDTAVESLP